MAWTKTKKGLVAIAAILTAAAIGVAIKAKVESSGIQSHRLADGSLLVLNRVSFANTNEFLHGGFLEKLLKDAIPTKGINFLGLNLARPTGHTFNAPAGKSELVVELKIAGTNLGTHPLVKPAFYREFRCMIRGENGIEYAEEFWPSEFERYSDGYFGYVNANSFPRDSKWLWLRVERRKNKEQTGPWESVAEFKFENKAKATIQPWKAEPVSVSKTIGGFDFVLNEITVVTQSYSPRDIWNHRITTPFEVRSNGLALTNWTAAYIRVEDASGNWNYILQSHRSLDPRFVWKLETDFEPASDFPPENIATVNVPRSGTSITTNLLNVPVTIFWDGRYIRASIPTNQPDLALRFVCVVDEKGNKSVEPSSGSWNQHHFYKGSFLFRDGNILTMAGKPTKVIFAIVPNVRATFYAQPRAVPGELN